MAIVLSVLGITLVGESLNDLADPRLRGRRAVESGAADVAATSVVPGGSLDTAGVEELGHGTSAGVEELR
jgi:peptide/nickel transport system permease protein